MSWREPGPEVQSFKAKEDDVTGRGREELREIGPLRIRPTPQESLSLLPFGLDPPHELMMIPIHRHVRQNRRVQVWRAFRVFRNVVTWADGVGGAILCR